VHDLDDDNAWQYDSVMNQYREGEVGSQMSDLDPSDRGRAAAVDGGSIGCRPAPRVESWATAWGMWDILGGAALGLVLAAALVR